MKTILGVYTNTVLTTKQISDRRLKKHCFRTEDAFVEGDMIETKTYTSKLQVTDIIDADYKYYNVVTGEMRNDINSTNCYPIKKLVLREDDEPIVYGRLVTK